MKNDRNITKTFINQQQQQQQQQQTAMKKARSMTPDTSFDDYDFLTVNRNNSKRQRPITPELIYKQSNLTNSQTSLMSRQSSGSRNSTLERQINGRISRNSSSSSDGENNNTRRQNRPPFKTAFGDYRIRRSR